MLVESVDPYVEGCLRRILVGQERAEDWYGLRILPPKNRSEEGPRDRGGGGVSPMMFTFVRLDWINGMLCESTDTFQVSAFTFEEAIMVVRSNRGCGAWRLAWVQM